MTASNWRGWQSRAARTAPQHQLLPSITLARHTLHLLSINLVNISNNIEGLGIRRRL
jgi:hypothetical protein